MTIALRLQPVGFAEEIRTTLADALQREAEQARLQRDHYAGVCRKFEQTHHLNSDEFMVRFERGDLGDNAFAFDWYAAERDLISGIAAFASSVESPCDRSRLPAQHSARYRQTPYLTSTEITFDETSRDECYIHGTLHLDGSSNFTSPNMWCCPRLKRLKYRYHLQQANSALITRWDNVAHHRHVSTFPHHRHDANREISASPPADLPYVVNNPSFALTMTCFPIEEQWLHLSSHIPSISRHNRVHPA